MELSTDVLRQETNRPRKETTRRDEEIRRGLRPAGVHDLLQIQATRKVWTQANPPVIAFRAGDCTTTGPRLGTWGGALKAPRGCVQFLDAKPDSRTARDGWAKIRPSEYADGQVTREQEVTVSQAEPARLPREGRLPEGL